MTPKVLVAVPTMGNVRTELAARLCSYIRTETPHITVRFIGNVQDHAAARNELINYHFSSIAYTHLLMVDADTVPPPHFIEDMLAVNRPVVSGVTYTWRAHVPNRPVPAPVPALWQRRFQIVDGRKEKHYVRFADFPKGRYYFEEEGLATGCFCMMIGAGVLDELHAPFFKTVYEEQSQAKIMSEDLYFCERLADAGVTIAIVPDIVCSHFKTIDLVDVREYGRSDYERRLKEFIDAPITEEPPMPGIDGFPKMR